MACGTSGIRGPVLKSVSATSRNAPGTTSPTAHAQLHSMKTCTSVGSPTQAACAHTGIEGWGLAGPVGRCDVPSSWWAVQAPGAGAGQPGQLGQGLFGGHLRVVQ